MNERDQMAELASRFLDLWQDQATAMAQDPEFERFCRTWMDIWTARMPPRSAGTGDETAQAGSAPASAAPRDGVSDMDAFARRLRHLEERVAALEGAAAGRSTGPDD